METFSSDGPFPAQVMIYAKGLDEQVDLVTLGLEKLNADNIVAYRQASGKRWIGFFFADYHARTVHDILASENRDYEVKPGSL